MITKRIIEMNRSEIESYVLNLQGVIKTNKQKGYNVDDFLDKTSIFDEFENLLNDEEYAIFILTMLNGFDSKFLINNIVDSIYNSINSGDVAK